MKKLTAIILLLCLLLTGCAAAAETEPDYAELYLQVFEDLWEVDSGLNDNIRYISVDLTEAPGELSSEKIAEITRAFAENHNIEGLTLTYEQLQEEGYLTDVGDGRHYQWDDGVLFTVTADGGKFDVQKWRSPLGAYFFEDCTVKWNRDGSVKSYTVGSEAIS